MDKVANKRVVNYLVKMYNLVNIKKLAKMF